MNIPQNYSDLLAAAKVADCFTWFRDSRHASLMIDDIPGDRRTCLDFRVDRLRLEYRTLSGFDPKGNKWAGGYCAPQGEVIFPDRRGGNAFFLWVREMSQREHAFPNMPFVHAYKGKVSPFITLQSLSA